LWGVPQPFLPTAGKPALTWLYGELVRRRTSVYLVADANSYRRCERWAMETGLPLDRVLNTGAAVGRKDVNFLEALDFIWHAKLKPLAPNTRLFLTDATLIPDPTHWPSLLAPTATSTVHAPASLCELTASGDLAKLGGDVPPMVMTLAGADALAAVDAYLDDPRTGTRYTDLVDFVASRASVRAVGVPKGAGSWRWMKGEVTAGEYLEVWSKFVPGGDVRVGAGTDLRMDAGVVSAKAYARVGLLGNPSDGFFGKTLALLLENFFAETLLVTNPDPYDTSVSIVPNQMCDPLRFASLRMASLACATDGYYGVTRLFLATLRVFWEHCEAEGIKLLRTGFRVVYTTNIPRQVGLAGSSALITSLWKALMQFHGVDSTRIPPAIAANLVLSVERDHLGIAAGYQDRVVQAYGGCVFMDFARPLMETRGYGDYRSIDISLLPPGLWMAYVAQPKESGKVHNDVKARFAAGDEKVTSAMSTFASLAEDGCAALLTKTLSVFAKLMDANFDLRRELYGDAVIGAQNLRLVAIAREHGHCAKFSGSGGCVIGMWRGEGGEDMREARTREMRRVMQREG
ncbi:ribosomal protein S5 domain 2-type protein, partial [Blyttiomyces helicus]